VRRPLVDPRRRRCHLLAMLRRRVIDLENATPVPIVCSGCGTSLVPIARRGLVRVAFPWRCVPGKEPKTDELRCQSCSRRLVV
jgi:hypothetical protein